MMRESMQRPARAGAALAVALGLGTLTTGAAQAAPPVVERPEGSVMRDGLRAQGWLREPGGPGEPAAVEVCAGDQTLFGIDVSYYQGSIDWEAVAADGVSFAWVRVSHSLQFFDPEFDTNLAGARAAGIHTGVYQYFEPGEDPIAQADLLLEATGPLQPGDMPPLIDVESPDTVPPAQYADAIRAWIDRVETATGVKPFIYTGFYYWNESVQTDEFADYPLWIANYNPGCPDIPDVWDTWVVHQYCACETVAGISGPVDGDTFNGSLADLMGYAVGGGECGDMACTGSEDPYSCPADCPPCGVIGADGGTIDNGDACYELYGNAMFWREEAAGIGGSLVWTNATEFEDPSNYAVWRLFFEEAGLYELEVHLEAAHAESEQAAYRIAHADGEAVEMIDQSSADGWVSLGEFQFEAGADHFVRLDDNTGELNEQEIAIVFDALRTTRLDGSNETGLDSSGEGEGTSSGGLTSGDAEPPGGTGGTGGGSESGETGLPGADGSGDGGGCGCRGGQGSGPTGGLLVLMLLGLAGRRRR